MSQVSLEAFANVSRGPTWSASVALELGVQRSPAWPDRFGEAMSAWLRARGARPVRTLSLFSGGGGLDVGFHDCGFVVQEMVEIEPGYAATLERNAALGKVFEGATVRCMDIREYHPPSDLRVDFVIGGPPCQTFSAAGRRAAGVLGTTDPRGALFEEYVRLLRRLKPRGFLFENVYGITGAEGGEAFERIRAAFREAGYETFHRVLDAADYGVPQHRERLFIVGLREGSYQFPAPTHGPDSPGHEPHYTAGEAVEGAATRGEKKGLKGRYGHLLDDIPPGLNYSFYTREMGHPTPIFAWRSKFSDFLYKADPEAPVRTIKAQGGQYTGPFHWENRPFSVAELKRLQTIPDAYEVLGNRGKAIQQIGNSVPPQLARILALSILTQAFGARLPFPLPLLDPARRLGFRSRKRLLTKRYADAAREALAGASKPRHRGASVVEEDATYERRLGANFAWGASEGDTLVVSAALGAEAWTFRACPLGETFRPRFAIEVSPAPGSAWPIPAPRARLEGGSLAPAVFTGLWKAFEEKVAQHTKVADLVQLSGYYQYEPRVRARLQHRPRDALPFWNALAKVVDGTVVARDEPATFFASAWGVERRDVLGIMLELRGLGYEVRNHRTNPQMTKGNFLVPYAFPTLTPQSVQLRKSLLGA
ncbi:MAG TPA: DNA cytosine methyltransferase [Candidatus Thermoplasmatota archaeon]|nr:DNA cytosine methyltransferase [Candidatus Thermoplasmatota archaeon]